VYPWKGKLDAERANTAESEIGDTSAVGCFPGGASAYDLADMSGNVWEWTRSIKLDYPYNPQDPRRETAKAGRDQSLVLRGGAFYDCYSVNARCAYRRGDNPNYGFDFNGFRVVCSPFFSR
jgi:formylglycine-generating enzyme required for sulfatase activity